MELILSKDGLWFQVYVQHAEKILTPVYSTLLADIDTRV